MSKTYPECRPAAELVAQMKAGWNLANTLECAGQKTLNARTTADFETAWGNPVTTCEMIKAVRDAGFGAVRLPVTWGPHMSGDNTIDKAWLDRVTEVVNYVLDCGMLCIVNVHHDTGEHGWLRAMGQPGDEMRRRFAAIWQQLCAHFADYDDRLIFEGYNEMLDAEAHWKFTDAASLEMLNELAQLFVNTVRASGGYNTTRNLVVNTYAGATHRHILRAFRLPEDTVEGHLIVEAHSYDPWGFTIATADWDRLTEVWEPHGDHMLKATFRRLERRFTSKGIPVIIGEYGCEDKNNTPERVKYMTRINSEAAKRGIVCFYWDMNEMHLLDRRSCRFDYPEVVEALMNSVK